MNAYLFKEETEFLLRAPIYSIENNLEMVVMKYNRQLSASSVVIKDKDVLLVKHTYGAAKGNYKIYV